MVRGDGIKQNETSLLLEVKDGTRLHHLSIAPTAHCWTLWSVQAERRTSCPAPARGWRVPAVHDKHSALCPFSKHLTVASDQTTVGEIHDDK